MNFRAYENIVVPDIQKIYDVSDKQIEILDSMVQDCENAISDDTMDEDICNRWEEICRLPKSDTTLENRRTLIKLYKNMRYHSTLKSLNKFIKALTSEYSEITLDGTVLTCKIIVPNRTFIAKLLRLLDELIPCHLAMEYEMGYKIYEELEHYTYAELAQCTYNDIENNTGVLKGV